MADLAQELDALLSEHMGSPLLAEPEELGRERLHVVVEVAYKQTTGRVMMLQPHH